MADQKTTKRYGRATKQEIFMRNRSALSFGIAIGIVLGAVGASLFVDSLKPKEKITQDSPIAESVSNDISLDVQNGDGTEEPSEKLRIDIQQARNLLKAETTEWARKLPSANTLEEEYFQLYMQIAYEKKGVDVFGLASRNLNLFRNVKNDKEFKSYITACLESAEVEKEKRVKDFVSRYTALIY